MILTRPTREHREQSKWILRLESHHRIYSSRTLSDQVLAHHQESASVHFCAKRILYTLTAKGDFRNVSKAMVSGCASNGDKGWLFSYWILEVFQRLSLGARMGDNAIQSKAWWSYFVASVSFSAVKFLPEELSPAGSGLIPEKSWWSLHREIVLCSGIWSTQESLRDSQNASCTAQASLDYLDHLMIYLDLHRHIVSYTGLLDFLDAVLKMDSCKVSLCKNISAKLSPNSSLCHNTLSCRFLATAM